ncbi:MAG: hypothetical protein ACI3WT_04445 [Phascolarctobacterium sp.]
MDTFVYNKNKSAIGLNGAISAMDAELLKEALVREGYGYTQEFFNTYCRLHKEKYREPFIFEESED